MLVHEFVENYKAKKFMNTPQGDIERMEWIRKELDVKSYIPFRDKRKIAEMIVEQNIKEVDGIKKYDSIDGYIDLMIASIASHTNLAFSNDPVADYDMLAESGLLPKIMAEFQGSHDEIDIILKMALAMELEDNNVNALVGRFLNKISMLLDGVVEVVKDGLADFDLADILGDEFNKEDLAKLSSFLDRMK